MPAPPHPTLLYTALMLRKLHELRGFGRALDAGAEGRYRAVLGEHLPGTVWIGVEEAWAPVLGKLRLRRHRGRLGCTDIRLTAASHWAGLDLALFEDVFEHLEPDEAVALAAAWLASTSLLLISLPAALPVGPMLPGLCARFVAGSAAVCCLSTDSTRVWQVTRLHGALPAMVRRLTGAA